MPARVGKIICFSFNYKQPKLFNYFTIIQDQVIAIQLQLQLQ